MSDILTTEGNKKPDPTTLLQRQACAIEESEERQNFYRNHPICPACRGLYISPNGKSATTSVDGVITQPVICDNCGATWVDQLKVMGFSHLTLKK